VQASSMQVSSMARLRSCQYCGWVHPADHDCGRRPVRKKVGSREAEQFRPSYKWQKKRECIRERDIHLCRACLAQGLLKGEGLEVHHIIPIEEEPELALADDNLITLCGTCHEKAECGAIGREFLRNLTRIPPGIGAKTCGNGSTPLSHPPS